MTPQPPLCSAYEQISLSVPDGFVIFAAVEPPQKEADGCTLAKAVPVHPVIDRLGECGDGLDLQLLRPPAAIMKRIVSARGRSTSSQ